MKIILETDSNFQVYVQKRDLSYLNQTGRTQYTAEQGKAVESGSSSYHPSSFVLFDGKTAVDYFKEQSDILSYQEYLEMPLSAFENYETKTPTGKNYFDESMLELLLEREGICSLPYPIDEERSRRLKQYETDFDTYSLYLSHIPKLYYLKKEGENSYLTRTTVPESFLEECNLKACVDTFEDEFMLVPTNQNDLLLFMPKPKEEEKEVQDSLAKKSYIKRLFTRKKR